MSPPSHWHRADTHWDHWDHVSSDQVTTHIGRKYSSPCPSPATSLSDHVGVRRLSAFTKMCKLLVCWPEKQEINVTRSIKTSCIIVVRFNSHRILRKVFLLNISLYPCNQIRFLVLWCMMWMDVIMWPQLYCVKYQIKANNQTLTGLGQECLWQAAMLDQMMNNISHVSVCVQYSEYVYITQSQCTSTHMFFVYPVSRYPPSKFHLVYIHREILRDRRESNKTKIGSSAFLKILAWDLYMAYWVNQIKMTNDLAY